MKFLKALLFIQLLFLFSFTLNAQVSAEFTVDLIQGCSPHEVTFTVSNQTGITEHSWDFGNENNSTLSSPGATYNQPGVFDVTLSVNGGVDTYTLQVTVFASPVAGITADNTIGCVPLNVNFEGDVTPGSGTDFTYIWEFYDGSPSTSNNPVKFYDTPGTYDIAFEVTDENGCSDDTTLTDYITVVDQPVAFFVLNQLSTCDPSSQFIVTNNGSEGSSIYSELNYSWDFGDGTVSDLEIPDPHVYGNLDSYTISLMVTDTINANCVATYELPVSTTSIEASFEIDNGEVACLGDVVIFNMTPSEDVNYSWNYGDGASGENDMHMYMAPGTYEIWLYAEAEGLTGPGCTDSIMHSITIEEVIADFATTPDPAYSCEVPFPVSYDASASSDNVVDYIWDFGNGIPGAGVNTTNTFTEEGNYTDILTVSSINGCSASASNNVIIDLPIANFTVDTLKGCGRSIEFTDLSVSTETITEWNWSFDNNDPATTSTEQNPSIDFTYNDYIHANGGVCNVELTITNNAGCEATYSMDVFIGIEPVPHHYIFSDPEGYPYYEGHFESCQFYTGNPDDEDPCPQGVNTYIACASPDSVQFNDSTEVIWNGNSQFLAYMPQDAYSYKWDFGEIGGISSEPHPYHFYDDTVGYMDIELIVGYHECYDTLVTDSMVYIKGPIIKPSPQFEFDCALPFDYVFTADIVSATEVIVDFGDGTADTIYYTDDITLISPDPFTISHNFELAGSGDYCVKFYAYNDSTNSLSGYALPDFDENGYLHPLYEDTLIHKHNCGFVDSIQVIVRDLEVYVSTDDSTICLGTKVNLDATVSQDDYQYQWTFNGNIFEDVANIDNEDSPKPTYLQSGIYHPLVEVTAKNGCADTASLDIYVFETQVGFVFDTLDRCVPFNVVFQDTSLVQPFGEINSWTWGFGDGNIESSQTIDTTHFYEESGSFDVSLTVTDTNNCPTTLVLNNAIVSNHPVAMFTPNDPTVCIGDEVTFNDNSTGNGLSYTWSIDGVEVSSDQGNYLHTFSAPGEFNVSLFVEETSDCVSDTVYSLISVQEAKADFYADVEDHKCNPALVQLYYDPEDLSGEVVQWDWDFGFSQSSIFDNPNSVGFFYTYPGTYTTSLHVTTSYGCEAEEIKVDHITIGGAYGEFEAMQSTVCIGQEVQFNIVDTINVDMIRWDYGDGNIEFGLNNMTHVYDTVANLTVSITVYDDFDNIENDCNNDNILIEIEIIDVTANFSITDPDEGCDHLDVAITNNSSDNPINNYSWGFGDGTTDESQNPPSHNYNSPGTYSITLTVSNDYCNMEFVDTVTVHQSPEISIMPDTLVCPGSEVELSATPDLTPQWYINGNLIGTTTEINQLITDSITFDYTVEDPNTHCTDAASVTVTVADDFDYSITVIPQHDPEVFEPPYNATIVIGDEINIIVEPSVANTSILWTPATGLDCDDCLSNNNLMPLENITYVIELIDELRCNVKTDTINIIVEELYKMDVPNAFTPNGDGKNDIVYVVEQGAIELIEYKIFNRWGQLVFQTDELTQGWDGTYKGKPQNVDTYVWMATVKFFDGSTKSKQGNITLIR